MTADDWALLDFEQQCRFNVDWPDFDAEVL